MQAQELIAEARILLDYVEHKKTSFAPGTMSVDVSSYTDSDRFAREQQALFRNYAQCIGPSCLLPSPGSFYAFNDCGIPIVVVRNADRRLAAFVNICPHRGAPVARTSDASGTGTARKDRLFSCPYHGWTFDLTGALVGVPGAEGFPDLDRSRNCLKSLHVVERDNLIFVMPTPGQQIDFDAVDGGFGAAMSGFGLGDHVLFGTKRVEVAINWKLNMDTFQEFYHFAALHPQSIATLSYSNIAHYRQLGCNHLMSAPLLNIGSLRALPEAQWRPRECVSFVGYVFPNTIFFVVADHFQLWRVFPINERRSVVYHSMYLQTMPATDEERLMRQQYFDMINAVAVTEDYTLVQEIQTAADSGIPRSVIFGRNEPGLQNMHRQIALHADGAQVATPAHA
jgi:phenylpropionate dioxygenase-like ring-hydroxylating dioxygenase large terminal subunit